MTQGTLTPRHALQLLAHIAMPKIFEAPCNEIPKQTREKIKEAKQTLEKYRSAVLPGFNRNEPVLQEVFDDLVKFGQFVIEECQNPVTLSEIDGTLTYSNAYFNRIIKETPSKVERIVAEESKEEWSHHWKNTIISGKSSCMVKLASSGNWTLCNSSIATISNHDVVMTFWNDRSELQEIIRMAEYQEGAIEKFIKSSHGVVCLVDKHGVILSVSSAWEKKYASEKKTSQIVGQYKSLFSQESKVHMENIKLAFSGKIIKDSPEEVYATFGTENVLKTYLPWFCDGAVKGVVIYTEKTNSASMLEDELARRKLMFREIFDHIPQPITILNASGRIIEANKRFSDICENTLSPICVIGKHIWEVCKIKRSENEIINILNSVIRNTEKKEFYINHFVKDPNGGVDILSTSVFKAFPPDIGHKSKLIIHKIITRPKEMNSKY